VLERVSFRPGQLTPRNASGEGHPLARGTRMARGAKRTTKRRRANDKSLAREKCWKAFSRYYRLLHADPYGFCRCYTCGHRMHWKHAQVGHFVRGRGNAVLCNEECVRIQCYHCNVEDHGNVEAYTLRMLQDVGPEKVAELLALRHAPKYVSLEEWRRLEAWYRSAARAAETPRGSP